MEDKNKTIKETLQGAADAGKRKKLIIKKKGDENSASSPSASPKKETIAESAPAKPVIPLPSRGDSGQSPIVRPAPSASKEVKYEESSRKQDPGQSGSRPPRDKDSQGRSSGDSSYPVSRSPFQKEDSNIIVSRPIQRPARPNSGGGYQGNNRGSGQGGGYQGNRGPGQGGYQGNRGPGQGGGYQGNRGPGQGGGYQGNRGPGQQAGPGNRFGGSGPGNRSGGPGGRPMPITSAEVELSQARGSTGASKKKGHDKEKTSSDKRDFSGAENTKFFKQRFKRPRSWAFPGSPFRKKLQY